MQKATYLNVNGDILSGTESNSLPGRREQYETMLIQNDSVFSAPLHWKRLFDGASIIFSSVLTLTKELLEEQIIRTVKKNELSKLCRVRLELYANDEKQFTGYKIECFTIEHSVLLLNEKGLIAGIATNIPKEITPVAPYKTGEPIYNAAIEQANKNDWNEALICNTKGNIIESTIANIFWIERGNIFTPPLSEGCIAGVMRSFMIDTLRKNNFPVEEKILDKTILLSADELFTTNVIRRIKWIASVENKIYSNKLIVDISHAIFS